MQTETYEGPVCYVGPGAAILTADGSVAREGFHYSAVTDPETGAETPGVPLFLDDGGVYHLADDTDESWHARKHQSFQTFELEDGSTIRVNEEEGNALKALLAQMREGSGQS